MTIEDSFTTPTQRRPLPALPPELIDAIIDLLHHDRLALATCALVCRSWVPASRRRLFSRFTIRKPSMCGPASDIFFPATCTIASAVRHLELYSAGDYRRKVYNSRGTDALREIIGKISSVTGLSLRGSIVLHGAAIFSHVAPLLRNLENLQLKSVLFWTSHLLIWLLRQVPRLRSLSCSEVRLRSTADEEARPQPQLLLSDSESILPELNILEVLHSSRVSSILLAHWASAVPRLRTLDLQVFAYLDRENADAKMLEAVAPSLEVLRLEVIRGVCLDIAPHFTLLTRLRSFSYDCHLNPINDVWFLIEALRRLASLSLDELSISLPSARCHELELDTWTALGLLLDSPRFHPTLRTLSFKFARGELKTTRQEAQARELWIAERFPVCAARGILQIDDASIRDYVGRPRTENFG